MSACPATDPVREDGILYLLDYLTSPDDPPQDVQPDGKSSPASTRRVGPHAVLATDPLYSTEDIRRIREFFLTRPRRIPYLRYRDYAFFVCGMHFMLREGDLLSLRVGDVAARQSDGSFAVRPSFGILTEKRRNDLEIPIVPNARAALELLLPTIPTLTENQALFYNCRTGEALSRQEGRKIIARALHAIGRTEKTGTHTLRKTGAWHLYQALLREGPPDQALRIVQQCLAQRDPGSLRHYLRITQRETDAAFSLLNL